VKTIKVALRTKLVSAWAVDLASSIPHELGLMLAGGQDDLDLPFEENHSVHR